MAGSLFDRFRLKLSKIRLTVQTATVKYAYGLSIKLSAAVSGIILINRKFS
ncbi:hypothetical protein NMYAN_40158 [Nitrosomonas nitrosa]|uniref:Uncharacterized protein n=1 Tax=Nitrosomonas nitrosa TaxID=52442 RepID=A0A8H8Z0Y4_9PROT|nr:hypothetical protein NMYAN_40158 [Nitrosomonas nitrosa]